MPKGNGGSGSPTIAAGEPRSAARRTIRAQPNDGVVPKIGGDGSGRFGANPRGDVKPRGTEVRRPFVLRVLPDRFALFQTRAWAFAPKPPKFRAHPSTATRCSASWRSPVVMVSPNHDHDAVATDDGSRLCGSAPGVLAQHSDD